MTRNSKQEMHGPQRQIYGRSAFQIENSKFKGPEVGTAKHSVLGNSKESGVLEGSRKGHRRSKVRKATSPRLSRTLWAAEWMKK